MTTFGELRVDSEILEGRTLCIYCNMTIAYVSIGHHHDVSNVPSSIKSMPVLNCVVSSLCHTNNSPEELKIHVKLLHLRPQVRVSGVTMSCAVRVLVKVRLLFIPTPMPFVRNYVTLMFGGIWTPLPLILPVHCYNEFILTSITPFFSNTIGNLFGEDKVEKAVLDHWPGHGLPLLAHERHFVRDVIGYSVKSLGEVPKENTKSKGTKNSRSVFQQASHNRT